jgi:hypothetical protein
VKVNVNVNVKKKKPGRKRRAAGRTLVALGLLVAGVWAASMYWHVACSEIRAGGVYSTVLVKSGKLHLLTGSLTADSHAKSGWGVWNSGEYDLQYRWRWFADRHDDWTNARFTNFKLVFLSQVTHYDSVLGRPYTYRVYGAFLWPVPPVLWTPAALLLRSASLARRRANTGACAKCGYSLAGLGVGRGGAKCPECGKTEGQPRMNAD